MNKRRDILTKWETQAIAEHVRWYGKDVTVIKLNKKVTAIKENDKWHVFDIEDKKETGT